LLALIWCIIVTRTVSKQETLGQFGNVQMVYDHHFGFFKLFLHLMFDVWVFFLLFTCLFCFSFVVVGKVYGLLRYEPSDISVSAGDIRKGE
jgi:hypothetical protein